MKKIVLTAMVMCAAIAAHAFVSWDFSGSNITGTDGTGFWSGYATITCNEVDSYSRNVEVNNGSFTANEFMSMSFTEGKTYTFVLSMSDWDYTYRQSATGTAVANDWGEVLGTVSFPGGNAWTQVVPEPTSGLLMLVGLAGIALKRKRNQA